METTETKKPPVTTTTMLTTLPAVLCGVVSTSHPSHFTGGVPIAFEAMTRCVRAVTLSVLVGLPLGVAAHVAAVAALPGRLCAACARETASVVLRRGGRRDGDEGGGDGDEGEVRALLSGLWAVATKPTLALACAREVKEDAEIL